jgi:CO/xanthine dehydrogenase FAD-binding subunit
VSIAGLALHPFAAPRSLDEALAILAGRAGKGEKTVLLAGGTDWFVERHVAPPEEAGPLPLVLDVSRLDALRGVALVEDPLRGDTLRVGGATTYLELRKDPRVLARCPLLSAMARDVGALQIQARGTLGGNLASGSPAADGVCALAALDATLLLASTRGRRRVALSAFYTGYRRSVLLAEELIEAVEVPLPSAGSPFVWRKVGTRQAQAISKVAFAGLAVVEKGRCLRLGLAMASVAPTVALLLKTRTLGLSGPLAEITDAAVEKAVLADVSPIDDVRSTAAYRRHVAVRLAQRFFEELRGR